ncbi:hypothetical protein F511_05173 [Dorcoceras hygrometricum]|uniref:5'-3' DNA helicase ZGRF1-like N-terminal domain-containing protein n=1 Tax=Dorcoceras hygrometricum TaxID=472368 RepID=A0A2Z7C9B7_9LAMI|nr:hypothetical protein F511_05173 [Dorcoceras hygrometricum]
MGNLKRWSVTYTKHVKQKRKVYQDGYLELGVSGNKIMLYDEYDKLLETRFAKKDDVIKSGESLTFDSYLVDVGELCGGNKPFSSFNCQDNKKVNEALDWRPSIGENSVRLKLSPSQKIIQEFKKSELNKYNSTSSPSSLDMTKSIKTEWQVLYTTQVTQKAKKFHDGFLQLIVRGSQGRQVMLSDTNRRLLDSRFLKKNELVNSGESLAFEGHLVEIGEQDKLPVDLTPPRKSHKIVGKCIPDGQAEVSGNEKFQAASEILSILRKPMIQEKFVSENKHLADSSLHSDIEHHINIYARNCSGTAEAKVIEEVLDDGCCTKILKCESVEILNDAENCFVSENPISQARSSAFCISSGTVNHTKIACNVDGTDNMCYNLAEHGSSLTVASTNDLSSNILEKFYEENKETSSVDHEEGVLGFGMADSNNGVFQDPSGVEQEALTFGFTTEEIADFPSFDLGF